MGENNPIFVVDHADGYERFRINGYGYCTLKPFNNSGINNTWIDSLSNNNKLFFGDANFGMGAGKFAYDMGSSTNSECTAIWCYQGLGRGIRFCSTYDGDGDKLSEMTTRMIINGGNGNVGIGTANPSTILTIKKPIDSSAYGSGTRMIDFKSYFPGYDETTVKASIYCGVSDEGSLSTRGGYMAFMTADGTNLPTERIRIERNGNVGIKEHSRKNARLHIQASNNRNLYDNKKSSSISIFVSTSYRCL